MNEPIRYKLDAQNRLLVDCAGGPDNRLVITDAKDVDARLRCAYRQLIELLIAEKQRATDGMPEIPSVTAPADPATAKERQEALDINTAVQQDNGMAGPVDPAGVTGGTVPAAPEVTDDLAGLNRHELVELIQNEGIDISIAVGVTNEKVRELIREARAAKLGSTEQE